MKNEIQKKLEGTIFTVYTSFDKNELINYQQIENYLVFLYENNVRNFYVMPYNSRYSQLYEKEIFELNNFVIKTVKSLNKENICIVSDSIHGPTSLSVEMGFDAFNTGCDIFASICREKYFSDAQVLQHYSRLSDSLKMPLLVHEMPFLSGFNAQNMKWPLTLIESLLEIENIVAIKEDAKEVEYGKKIIELLEPHIRVIFAGRKSYFADLYQYGLKAYLNGISMINPEIGFYFWDILQKDEKSKIKYFLNEIDNFFWDNVNQKYGWHRVNKAYLEAAGLMSRYERSPLKPLDENEFKEIKDNYKMLIDRFRDLVS
jgi:dihydrodipicolinate synthase/N-acetylneuraminate lyase